jgi:pimeloyl-ACP methyl ester carboxylesterase
MKTALLSGILGISCIASLACGGEEPRADDPADDADIVADNAAGSADDVNERDGDPRDGDVSPGEEGPGAAAVGVTTPNDEEPVDLSLRPAAALTWRSCGAFQDRDLQCAEVLVPVDYDQLDGEMLPIAMRRIVANPLEPYRGSLLINPGGPGGAGIDFALDSLPAGIFDTIAPGYDIVGFDPRGVGESGERGCGIESEELYPSAVEVPTDDLGMFLAWEAERGSRCEQAWGPLFRKLGSMNVVRDMEEIRKALEEGKLNFYGASYGTRLGSLYAHMFPSTTGRIVLDASVHPRSSWVESVRDTFYRLAAMHEQLFVDCEAGVLTCPPEPRVLFEQVLGTARERGLEDALNGFWKGALESEGGPEALVSVLSAEAGDPGGAWLDELLSSTGGQDDGGAGEVALVTVNCTDDVLEPPTVAQIQSLHTEFNAVNPFYANEAVAAVMCTGWPVTREPVPLPTALGVDEPVLVIGGLNDWRTPYSQSVAMAEALGKATLLTSNHQGHAAAVRPNDTCVHYFVRAYLTSGSLPATGTVCE